MTDQNGSAFRLSDAMLLAVLPAISYGMAYLYEAGFCSVYKIPWEFISVSAGAFLSVTFGLVSSLFFVAWFWNIVWAILYPELLKTAVGRAIHQMAVIASVVACWLVLARPSGIFYLVSVGFLLLIAFFIFLFPLITNRHRTGYANKLEGQENIERRTSLLSDRLFDRLPYNLRLILLVSLCLLISAFFLGFGNARNQSDFLVPTSRPDTVVLRRYSDVFILAKFDRESKVVTSEFSFVNVTGGSGVAEAETFRRERVGPLKPARESDSEK